MIDPATNTPTNATVQLIGELNGLLADHFALYMKTKNFHWHVKGPRFRDLHLLFDDHATEIQAQIDVIAERVRKLGGDTLTSIGSIAAATSITDQDNAQISAEDMVAELRDDNAVMLAKIKAMKDVADRAGDNATDGMLDDWTDQAEQRVWFLNSVLG